MAVPWEPVSLVVGFVYGYMKKGRQDKSQILRTGLLWGALLGAVIVAIGLFTGVGLVEAGAGYLVLMFWFLIVTVLFVLGVFLGDWAEGAWN